MQENFVKIRPYLRLKVFRRYFKAIKDREMARKCFFTGKGPMVGNNVSHANNKTKKRSLPNLRSIRIKLEDGTSVRVKVAASTLRTMKKHNS